MKPPKPTLLYIPGVGVSGKENAHSPPNEVMPRHFETRAFFSKKENPIIFKGEGVEPNGLG